MKVLTYGVPVSQQVNITLDDWELEDVKEENLVARAILVKIFASDIYPITGDDLEQLSRMYSKTFAISNTTKISHLMQEACKFWGVLASDYGMWYEDAVSDDGITMISEEQMKWNVTLILNTLSFPDKNKDLKPHKKYATFFIGF